MKQRHGWLGRTACLILAVGLAAQPALAYYPHGFFSPGGQGGQLILVAWPFSVMDVNGDGDVSGDADGVPLNFEAGPGGFTENEIVRLFSGYEEWERIGTSFAAFSRGPDLTDPVELVSGFDQIDGINAVVFQSPTDPVIVPDGAIGLTLFTYVLEPTTVVIGNQPVLFTEPQPIDIDTVFGAGLFGVDAVLVDGLEGEGAFAGGRTLGAGDAALSNFVSNVPNAQGFFVEEEVVTLRNFQGILEPRGVSATMLNLIPAVDLGNGVFKHAEADVAIDDIAFVTNHYPRSDSDLFFDITGYARTRSTTQIPSVPISGAWIRAYVNANNTNNRVPVVDTFTGLYTPPINPTDSNRFVLKGLLKQMETPGGVTFAANYTLTMAEFAPITDFDPASGLDTRTSLDSTHGGFGVDGTPANYTGFGFDSLFLSEVFNESGNIVGSQNLSQGTPLAFDIVRREVVSTLSGLSLLEIVGPERIIFGDDGKGAIPTTGCPFNQIITAPATIAGGGPSTPEFLRNFRDSILLETAVGVAVTDVYYRVSPILAQSVRTNAIVEQAFRTSVALSDFMLRYPSMLLSMLGGLFLALAVAKSRRKQYAIVATVLLFAFALLISPVSAKTLPRSLSEFVSDSDHVVHGTVESVTSYWSADGDRIVTDVTIRIVDAVKGRMNRGGLLHIQLPTGQVGAVVRTSPELPEFATGEETVLFLQDAGERGFGVVGGKRGKFVVKETPSETKYVGVMAPPPNPHLRQAAAEIKALREGRPVEDATTASDPVEDGADEKSTDEGSDGPITLEEFKDYIRYLDRELRKKER